MAWEKRSGRDVFYRSVRHGGTVGRLYMGSGEKAVAAAAEVAASKEARAQERKQLEQAREETDPLDELDDQLDAGLSVLIEAVLRSRGFHQHRGQWRQWHGSE